MWLCSVCPIIVLCDVISNWYIHHTNIMRYEWDECDRDSERWEIESAHKREGEQVREREKEKQ